MADIARRRAAHFAHFNEQGDDEDEGNVHAGGKQARTLGPWSSAYELVNAREKAAEQRREKLRLSTVHNGAEQQSDGAVRHGAPSTALPAWAPKRDPSLGPRPGPVVPSLRELCMRLLVSYIDCVESLYGVPDSVRCALAAAVCAGRALTPQAAAMFAADAPTELLLPDCSQLDREAMVAVVREVTTPRLERLELGMCGRGFGDASLKKLQGSRPGMVTVPAEACDTLARLAAACPGGTLPLLQRLRLGGAYRLNDAGLRMLLAVMPGLRHLAVPDACRLTGRAVDALASAAPGLTHLDVGGCRGIDAPSLAAALPRLKALKHLVLDGIPEVDDAVLVAAAACPALVSLSVSYCGQVTDAGVRALVAARPRLEALKCDKCDKVTDAGLQALASCCAQLKVLCVGRLPRLTDAGLVPIAARGALEHVALHGAAAVSDKALAQLAATCHATLTHLDVSFCRRLSGDALGHLVDRCTKLSTLLVFGCSQLGNRFAHGHTNEALVLGGLQGLGTAVTLPG